VNEIRYPNNAKKEVSVPDVALWTSFATGLRRVGLKLFADADVKVTEERAADLRILGLMLLARTLSNLQGALILLREKRIAEARILTRSCYENQFWVLGLLQDGDKFRSEMVHDEMKHKTARVQTLFEKRVELDDEIENKLRTWIRENKKWSDSKTLNPKGVALKGADQFYIFYQHLSLDAHPSIEALNRYFVQPDADGVPGIDVDPLIMPTEVIETINLLCLPVIGVFLGVSELLGSKETPPDLGAIAVEYKRLTEETGKVKA
jgi:uncharacterized protein YdcH (DUF465 family)